MIVKPEAIDEAIKQLIKIMLILRLAKSLSHKIKFSQDKKNSCLGQPDLFETLEKELGEQVMKVLSHKTLGTP